MSAPNSGWAASDADPDAKYSDFKPRSLDIQRLYLAIHVVELDRLFFGPYINVTFCTELKLATERLIDWVEDTGDRPGGFFEGEDSFSGEDFDDQLMVPRFFGIDVHSDELYE